MNKGTPELLKVNLLLTSLTVQRFRMSEVYWRNFLLAPDKEHKNVFPELPIVGLRNGKSLKDYLVRVALPKMLLAKIGGGGGGVDENKYNVAIHHRY